MKDTYNYKGWLNSDNFFKRVVAVGAYGLLAELLLVAVLLAPFLIAFLLGFSISFFQW